MAKINGNTGSEVRYGQRLVPQIIDESASHNPTRLVGLIAKSADVSKGFNKVTIGDVARAIDFMAFWLDEKLGKQADFETGSNDFRYWAVVFGGNKCSRKILLPSVRNSTANNVFLLQETSCKTVLCTKSLERVAKELREHVDVQILMIPSWNEMVCPLPKSYVYTKTWEEARDDQIIVLHTSGSTGNPKPIPYTHAFLSFFDAVRTLPAENGKRPHNVSALELGHSDYFYMAFPLFHLVGLSFSMRSLLYDGVVVLGPSQAVQNSKIVNDIMAVMPCKAIALPPSLLEDMVKEYREEFEQNSGELLHVFYGGGPLAESTGNYLSRRVRDMCMIYGQTEIAMPPLLVPEPEDWQYFHFHPTHSGIEMEPIHDEEDHFELILNRQSPNVWHQPVFENFPHLEQWRTKDLFKKHPTKPELWLFKGRKDDIIVLSNAEKFNPVSTEIVIQGHPAVKGALVVGTGRFQCALIIEPQAHADNEELLDQIWPIIEEANTQSPGHGQIDRQLVMISRAEKPFQRAGKGTVMRYLTTQNYAEEIDQLYSAFEKQVSHDLPFRQAPKSPSAVRQLIWEIFRRQIRTHDVPDEADFLEAGLDSLKITQIAHDLQRALGSSLGPRTVTNRILYENPSISKLCSAICELLGNQDTNSNDYARDARRVEEMKSLIDKFTSNIPLCPIIPQIKIGHQEGSPINVILTGSTGSLGSQILDQLLEDPKIGTICCLDRSADANERFIKRRLAQDKRINNPFSRIRWLQVNTSESKFSLSDQKFEALLQDVDAIILNAWKVDFNHSFSSFTRQIQSIHNFANFSILSPRSPHLFFISSTSAVGNFSSLTKIPETIPPNLAVASPLGYSESKLVSEHILNEIAKSAPGNVSFNVLRIGQIAGPLKGPGSWNENEWFPALLKSSRMLGMVPGSLGVMNGVDWVPVDLAAEVVTDFLHFSFEGPEEVDEGERGAKVFNLVNPSSVKFGSLVPAIKKRLGACIEVVNFDAWVEALEELDKEDEDVLERYPALRILEFFRGLRTDGNEKEMEFVTERSMSASQTMREMELVSVKMMER
ncbi:related to NRPS-like enzyme [Phialocephala subalpina]|uniref:Related to NRPS-like enzyme n=1 Tax=Phialocephala subalpina TaxID=576137 RepID=A0A1L7WWG5_9HELO|nr:related to NRPS-like enzyme [Phialocephala subalpina]